MDQKISVKIAGRMFNLTASSPDAEQLYRLAAETINKRFASYTRSHPGKNVSDLLSMIALNETVLRLGLQKDIDQYHEAEQQLARDLENYLKDNGQK
jgi:cell division protein ZapA (FtsZ GTPase activity inhibitor)